MGERKVPNQYYPPDFDPSKLPRRRRQPKNHQMNMYMMLPMSIRCKSCRSYIGKGTKFNSRKEDVLGETYLGIQIFRFYFKCTTCSAEITYKTDPQNSDYTVEAGATRNFEPWRSTDEASDEARKKRDAGEMGDAMKALENRTMDSKQEMDIISSIDELMSMNARRPHALGTELGLKALRRTADMKEKELAEEDEAILRTVVFRNSAKFFQRLEDDEFDDDDAGNVPTSKRARPSFYDTGGSKVSRASFVVSSSQRLTPAAVKKASAFTRPRFAGISRKIEQIQSASAEQIHHKQIETSVSPNLMLSTSTNIDTNSSDDHAPTCLASLCAYIDDSSSDS